MDLRGGVCGDGGGRFFKIHILILLFLGKDCSSRETSKNSKRRGEQMPLDVHCDNFM